jgi:hypothetical protein
MDGRRQRTRLVMEMEGKTVRRRALSVVAEAVPGQIRPQPRQPGADFKIGRIDLQGQPVKPISRHATPPPSDFG